MPQNAEPEINQDKVNSALEWIARGLEEFERPAIGYSGGKDSEVVRYLVRQIRPETTCYHCNTGVEAIETIKQVATIENCIILHPADGITFFGGVKEKGWPVMKGKGKKKVNWCCDDLKDKPMKRAIKKYNIDLLFDGITSAESHQRHMFLSAYGPYHFVKSWNVHKCHPIHDWTEDEVWAFIRKKNIPYNTRYDKGAVRIGCEPCTAYLSWRERLAKENPKMLRLIMKKRYLIEIPITDWGNKCQ